MGKVKAIWRSGRTVFATLLAAPAAIAILWIGLGVTSSGLIAVRSYLLLLSLIIAVLFVCGLSTEKPIVWVPALVMILVLLFGLGSGLYFYGWLDPLLGRQTHYMIPCECFSTLDFCAEMLAKCRGTEIARATQQAPPAWWPRYTPSAWNAP